MKAFSSFTSSIEKREKQRKALGGRRSEATLFGQTKKRELSGQFTRRKTFGASLGLIQKPLHFPLMINSTSCTAKFPSLETQLLAIKMLMFILPTIERHSGRSERSTPSSSLPRSRLRRFAKFIAQIEASSEKERAKKIIKTFASMSLRQSVALCCTRMKNYGHFN